MMIEFATLYGDKFPRMPMPLIMMYGQQRAIREQSCILDFCFILRVSHYYRNTPTLLCARLHLIYFIVRAT